MICRLKRDLKSRLKIDYAKKETCKVDYAL